MLVLRTGIGPIYWLLSRSEEERWHSYPEIAVYMKEHFTTYLSDIGRKVSELLPILSVYPLVRSGLNDMRNLT